jgi:tRNA-2-methylthio-N6-dimethylallyladenosine synthase
MVDDFVAPEVTQERMARLTELVEEHALVKHEARVGCNEPLLLEGPSKNDDTMWSGRTRQNKLVHFAPGEREPVVGGAAEVVVTYAAPHWLRGDLVDLAPPPSVTRPARIRIPVAAAPA